MMGCSWLSAAFSSTAVRAPGAIYCRGRRPVTAAPYPTSAIGKLGHRKQPSDVSSRVLGIGSTVLAGGRAFLGQGFTVILLLFFFLASSESLLRRLVEILPRFDDKRRAVSIVTEIEDSIGTLFLAAPSTCQRHLVPRCAEHLPIPVMFNGNARACGNGTAVNEYQARHRSPN